jgi:hypothetical protein
MGLKLITATAIAAALTLGVMPSSVTAQTTVRVECSGTYGQSCTGQGGSTYNSQTQYYCRDNNTCFPIHEVAGTAVDPTVMAGLAGVIFTGAAAAVVKIKNRVA